MDSFIYGSMKKYRIKFLIILITLFLLWILYFISNSAYILNRFTDHPWLNESHFSENTETIKIPKPFELHRNDDLLIKDYALKDTSYWMGNRYEFKVSLNEISPIDSDITNETTNTGNEASKKEISAKLWMAKIGDKDVVVLTYPDFDPEQDIEVTGIFTEIPNIINYQLANVFSENPDSEICSLMLDTRGVEMESESFDVVFSFVTLLILIFLSVKLSIQFADYHKTPTYRQLEKYGDADEVVKLIEKEIENATGAGKQYVLENWILTPDTFKLKIVRNHMKHGSFKYV